ncbi:MaoC/PaaZ C-terminal domain-containing protein [Thalassospiraceae bacterium LMO-JJ14]|nr:MaoC/PaaZ C-terminal domain-containing protein [Thalassospiraceae bacterium LMO-JJ14]
MNRNMAELAAAPGGPLAVSGWIDIDQTRVDAFADATHHTHWLHTDPARAKADGRYGGTVAHGFLILSLINHAIDQCGLRPTDSPYALNYGVDKVRFLKPMPIGDGFRVRDRISLIAAEMHDAGLFTRTGHAFEIEGDDSEKPCVVAEYLSVWVRPGA